MSDTEFNTQWETAGWRCSRNNFLIFQGSGAHKSLIRAPKLMITRNGFTCSCAVNCSFSNFCQFSCYHEGSLNVLFVFFQFNNPPGLILPSKWRETPVPIDTADDFNLFIGKLLDFLACSMNSQPIATMIWFFF